MRWRKVSKRVVVVQVGLQRLDPVLGEELLVDVEHDLGLGPGRTDDVDAEALWAFTASTGHFDLEASVKKIVEFPGDCGFGLGIITHWIWGC